LALGATNTSLKSSTCENMETQHITTPKSLQALPTEQKPNFARTAKFEG